MLPLCREKRRHQRLDHLGLCLPRPLVLASGLLFVLGSSFRDCPYCAKSYIVHQRVIYGCGMRRRLNGKPNFAVPLAPPLEERVLVPPKSVAPGLIHHRTALPNMDVSSIASRFAFGSGWQCAESALKW